MGLISKVKDKAVEFAKMIKDDWPQAALLSALAIFIALIIAADGVMLFLLLVSSSFDILQKVVLALIWLMANLWMLGALGKTVEVKKG